MKQVGLIVNPKAGRGLFESVRHDLMRVLAAHGFQAHVRATTAEPESARVLALEASKTCDLVLACGGDGTVHGVLQGLAETAAVLGVLPLGTANALARNLQLPLHPVQALEKLLTYKPGQISLGLAETSGGGSRWFTVMAGAGPDGRLVHELQGAAKAEGGRRAYYTKAARLFMTRRFPVFHVEYRATGSAVWERQEAVAMMCSRVPDLGGLFAGLTSGARLQHPHLLIQVLRAPAHIALPAWIGFARAGYAAMNPWLTSVAVEEVRCTPTLLGQPVYAQVDGEAFGRLPLWARVAPEALRLLQPRGDQKRRR